MKKSDLKTGMYLVSTANMLAKVFMNTSKGDFIKDLAFNKDFMFEEFPNDISKWKLHDEKIKEIIEPSHTEYYIYDYNNIYNSKKTVVWKREVKHTVAIDGVEKEVSDESFQNLKELFEGLE